jgi:branched-chain amino acid transport system permease protein
LEFWISQLFNGISYGALLFLLAGGLSLIFGMMRIVNMTHGSYYLLGGYVALSVIWRTGSFALAVVLGALTISLVGIAEWNAFLKRLSGQELGQVLTTMGFALIFQDLALVIWGGDPYTIAVPAALSGSLVLGQMYFPIYRIFIIAVAILIAVILWLTLEWTRVGAMIRATVDDPEMARGVGINVYLSRWSSSRWARPWRRWPVSWPAASSVSIPAPTSRFFRMRSWWSSWAAWEASRVP